MKSEKGFTLTELIAVIMLLAVIALVGTPIIFGVIEDVRENNRENKVKVYVQEVQNVYMLKMTEDNFYAFDSEEKGGITENNVVNFTNDWLNENVSVSGVDCSGTNTMSNVYFNTFTETIELTGCVVDGVEGYTYLDGYVIKK